jgi:hypothetical protein
MNEREKFLLDLRGYLVVPDFLSPAEVATLNAAVDANSTQNTKWDEEGGYGRGMAGGGRGTIDGCLTWPQPHCLAFRHLITHPKIIPYLDTLFGRGWRLDHGVGVHTARKGSGGHGLHGSSSRFFDPPYYYHHANGQIRTGMTRVQYQLRDIGPGLGGLALIPGTEPTAPLQLLCARTGLAIMTAVGSDDNSCARWYACHMRYRQPQSEFHRARGHRALRCQHGMRDQCGRQGWKHGHLYAATRHTRLPVLDCACPRVLTGLAVALSAVWCTQSWRRQSTVLFHGRLTTSGALSCILCAQFHVALCTQCNDD